jgi:hypothetical protein
MQGVQGGRSVPLGQSPSYLGMSHYIKMKQQYSFENGSQTLFLCIAFLCIFMVFFKIGPLCDVLTEGLVSM